MTGPSHPAAVLVVDDHDANRFAKTAWLRRAGFGVVEASTGRGALDALSRQPADVVLLDINLPDMSGLEVCSRIKKDPNLSTIQVLQISATAVTDADRIRGLDGGADAYLAEPSAPDVVVATIHALLRVRRAEQDRKGAFEREQDARRQAEQANRIKDNFLATLSHELRTPLNAALGWITLLKGGMLDAARQQRAIEALERSAKQQWTLINELLDAASIQQRKMRLEISTVDLEEIGAAVVELVRAEAAAKGVELAVSIEPARVNGDSARLQQVITNLLNNALQFTDAGGRVSLDISRERPHVVIRVEDSGIGIDPRFLPHVFEEFRQADGAGAGKGGLGLGLAISRHIVELHGGRIEAASDGIGRGAIFTVRIPAASQTDAKTAEAATG
jgi:two-component system, sensor histidine kinase